MAETGRQGWTRMSGDRLLPGPRAKRIDDATASQLEDILAQRVNDQKPVPESEPMVRRQIDQQPGYPTIREL
jgi:hypothetical protein